MSSWWWRCILAGARWNENINYDSITMAKSSTCYVRLLFYLYRLILRLLEDIFQVVNLWTDFQHFGGRTLQTDFVLRYACRYFLHLRSFLCCLLEELWCKHMMSICFWMYWMFDPGRNSIQNCKANSYWANMRQVLPCRIKMRSPPWTWQTQPDDL